MQSFESTSQKTHITLLVKWSWKKYINIHNENSICISREKFITPLNLTLRKTFCTKLVLLLSTEKEDFWSSFPASVKKTLLYNSSCSVSEDKATDGIGNVIMAGAPQRCVWAANLAPGHCRWDTSLCALFLSCLCSLPPLPRPLLSLYWADLYAAF